MCIDQTNPGMAGSSQNGFDQTMKDIIPDMVISSVCWLLV